LTAEAQDSRVLLDWDDNREWDLKRYRVKRSTKPEAEYEDVAEDVRESEYTDAGLPGCTYYYLVIAVDRDGYESAPSQRVEVTVIDATPPSFMRGDSNAEGTLDIADAIFTLSYLFAEGPTPSCLDAADANDDGAIDLADGIYILQLLFANGPAIPSPHPGCGIDPPGDALGCVEYEHCP
jgi:hypothetical protein